MDKWPHSCWHWILGMLMIGGTIILIKQYWDMVGDSIWQLQNWLNNKL